MPRPQRLQEAGYIHHVISRGNDGQVLFKSPEDFQKYIALINLARSEHTVKIYNYVLMDNFVHLLLEPVDDGNLSKFMQIITKEYAKYFNRKYNRRGHVFEGRFKSFLVQEERYFYACSRTIDLTPVKLNRTSDPKDYLYNGYSTLTTGKVGALKLDVHELYTKLGADAKERQIAYRTLVVNYQGEELDLMDKRAGVLGDKEFKKRFKHKR